MSNLRERILNSCTLPLGLTVGVLWVVEDCFAQGASVELASINRVLSKVGLVLVVGHWDGQGERELSKDATRFEITTEREWARRTAEPGARDDG